MLPPPDLCQVSDAGRKIVAPGRHSEFFAVLTVFLLNLFGLETFRCSPHLRCVDECVDSKRARCHCPYRKLDPDVLVMQPAENGSRLDTSRSLNSTVNGRILA